MASIVYWISVVVPGVGEIYVNPDDLEDEEVVPEVQEFMDNVVALAESRGWIVRYCGLGDHDDRPPDDLA